MYLSIFVPTGDIVNIIQQMLIMLNEHYPQQLILYSKPEEIKGKVIIPNKQL